MLPPRAASSLPCAGLIAIDDDFRILTVRDRLPEDVERLLLPDRTLRAQ